MSRPHAQTIIQAEQALAILREATEPMTATAIGKLVGYSCLIRCRPEGHELGRELRAGLTCLGDGTDLYVRQGMLGSHMTGALVVLLHQGRVSREKVGRRVHWSYVERPEDVEASRILAQLSGAQTPAD